MHVCSLDIGHFTTPERQARLLEVTGGWPYLTEPAVARAAKHGSEDAALAELVKELETDDGADVTCRLQDTLVRASAFQEVYHPESTYLEKPPTAQLTRIDAADRLFSVSLTRLTSVPKCAVSSVGFLWGSAAVSLSCGVSVGLAEAPDWAGRSARGTQVRRLPDPNDHFPVIQCHQGDLAGCSNSTVSLPIIRHMRRRARSLI